MLCIESDTKNDRAALRRAANDVMDMLRTNQWEARIIRAVDPDPLSVPKGGNIEFYFIRQNPRLGNLLIRSDKLARALINFNADLLPELEQFRVCDRCFRMHFKPDTQPHAGCTLGYLLARSGEYQVFRSAGYEMRLNDAKDGQLVYKPIHGLLAEYVARAVLY